MSDDNQSSASDPGADEEYNDLLAKFDFLKDGAEKIAVPAAYWISLMKILRLSQQTNLDLISFVLAAEAEDEGDQMQRVFDEIMEKYDHINDGIKLIEKYVMKSALKMYQDKGDGHD